MKKNAHDIFFMCKNIQEQRIANIDVEIFLYKVPEYLHHSKEEKRARIEYKLKKEKKNIYRAMILRGEYNNECRIGKKNILGNF